jgi:hypothetical protein
MLDPEDPSVRRFEIDWNESGPLLGWTTGWFWWRGYSTPAYATATVGAAGDITFPITCRWADGEFHQMFWLRYDRARDAVDLISQTPETNDRDLDMDSVEVSTFEIDQDEFSPDILFSHIASILDVALLTVEQAAEYTYADFAIRPADDEMWRPVDVGQEPVEFATDNELM